MRRRELIERLQAIFLTKSLENWKEIFVNADLPFAPIQTLEEVIDSFKGEGVV
jgi:crotonobetainyl-CoA:carnitine CoA-transferase CaiB-like acyl-CoA transferase